MAKSPDAFRTIGEVSDVLDTPPHVLRFWESKFAQVKPVKRAGGRRYYRPDDLALLGGIRVLLHEQGLTIKGAQKVLRDQGVKHVADLGLSALEDAQDDRTGAADVIDHVPSDSSKLTGVPTSASAPSDDTESIRAEDAASPASAQPSEPRSQVVPLRPRPAGATRPALLSLAARSDPENLLREADTLGPLLDRLDALHDRLRQGR
ncbi:MerR family transcriptional regulator [Salipiger sp. IMCC34102]|uniref:MerR family transcriptional regulator n=1 Tax=Salipiger sp. IMCC34102 TaxID=2510647 RepID=UPI00101BEF2E|nr:MerR family transcriptional regulator [Salipiger sp. IMCC34102]RYH03235.1 MerR family transcriptional regulator [Salipiger sp. IMCC34102]